MNLYCLCLWVLFFQEEASQLSYVDNFTSLKSFHIIRVISAFIQKLCILWLRNNDCTAFIIKTIVATKMLCGSMWLILSADDVFVKLQWRELLPAAAWTHQSRSWGRRVAGRIFHRLWHGHLLLYWPAASHRKYSSSQWLYEELSGLPDHTSICTSKSVTFLHIVWLKDTNNLARSLFS